MLQATVSPSVFDILSRLDDEIGLNWFKHAKAAGTADDLLRVVTADGMFTTKVDGWIHAANVTTMSIARFANEPGAQQVDMEQITSWSGGNSALRYGRWQTDFHWKIDTRLWQYVLYLKFMRNAYRDAINDCRDFSSEDRGPLQTVVTEFFDQAELTMLYRWEVIERSRGFALHPDVTAGAKDRGYTYEVLRPLPTPRFEDLPMQLMADRTPAKPAETEALLPPFPRIEGVLSTPSQQLAGAWLVHAQAAEIADRWLRVRLGDRMVPTRFNGWESGIEATLPFLRAFAEGQRLQLEVAAKPAGDLQSLDLADHAVRFALAQSEFQHRLEGASGELNALLQGQQQTLEECVRRDGALFGRPISLEAVTAFFSKAMTTVQFAFLKGIRCDEDTLPELNAGRPIHPRFAAEDPMEPLPWQAKDPAAYRQRMERLGYTI